MPPWSIGGNRFFAHIRSPIHSLEACICINDFVEFIVNRPFRTIGKAPSSASDMALFTYGLTGVLNNSNQSSHKESTTRLAYLRGTFRALAHWVWYANELLSLCFRLNEIAYQWMKWYERSLCLKLVTEPVVTHLHCGNWLHAFISFRLSILYLRSTPQLKDISTSSH